MAELPSGVQRDLISRFIDLSKINWAHVAIAQLLAEGWVDRVLTTNFDSLVVRACALIGLHPAVYDFAVSQLLKPEQVPERVVFHLHGQRTGFVLMNTEEDCEAHSKRLGPLFRDAGRGRTWVVVGYSGDNDPVFDHLAGVDRFEYGLYWVGYQDEEPPIHVRDKLLVPEKQASYLRGHDADSFFVELAQRLDCFPPRFVGEPFSHLETLLEDLTEFELAQDGRTIDVMATPRSLIEQARARYERSEGEDTSKAELAAVPLMMAGHYEKAIVLLTKAQTLSDAGRNHLAWSYIELGNRLGDQANARLAEEADRLFEAAGEKFAQAIAIKPDQHDALYNWGTTLGDQAKTKTGNEADRLFEAAGEKFAQAIAIKPDQHDAIYNWGTTLGDQAKTKTGDEADRLFEAAGEKYAQAVAIKPDKYEALNNWGTTLGGQAKTKTGDEADRLFEAAGEKFAQAIAIKPDKYEALNNWGTTLGGQAKTKTGDEADRLFEAAGEKFAQAIAIKPDKHEALNNWGTTLGGQAKTKTGDEADRLFEAAGEKYAQAIAIKPDKHEALNNWGTTLGGQAKTKTGDEADRLFEAAGEKFAQAISIKPDDHATPVNFGAVLLDQAAKRTDATSGEILKRSVELLTRAEKLGSTAALYNLACAHSRGGNEEAAKQYLRAAQEQGVLPDLDHLETDADLDPVRSRRWFKDLIANLGS